MTSFSKLGKWSSYEELIREHQVTYVAGGAAQNAARGAAVSSRLEEYSLYCRPNNWA